MRGSSDRYSPVSAGCGALKSHSCQTSPCQHQSWAEQRNFKPMYSSLELATSVYQRHPNNAHKQNWDNRLYHSSSIVTPSKAAKSSQAWPYSLRKPAACLVCCSPVPLHSQLVQRCTHSHCLPEELEVVALLQVPASASFLCIKHTCLTHTPCSRTAHKLFWLMLAPYLAHFYIVLPNNSSVFLSKASMPFVNGKCFLSLSVA